MRNTFTHAALVAGLLLFGFAKSSHGQVRYTITPIYAPEGGRIPNPVDINAGGEVAGTFYMPGRLHEQGFLYSSGTSTQLLPELEIVRPRAINAHGDIVGNTSDGPFWIVGGAAQDLSAVDGIVSEFNDINDAGQIAGTGRSVSEFPVAILFEDGVISELGSLAPGSDCPDSHAYSLNAYGQVAGTSQVKFPVDTTIHAFLFSEGVMKDLGTLGDPVKWSEACAMNDAGQVVGSSYHSGYLTSHAFLFSQGQMLDLGTLKPPYNISVARGINNSGEIVGIAYENADNTLPFLYSEGKMKDLNTLVQLSDGNSPGFTRLRAALAINDAGQIVGTGDYISPEGSSGGAAFLLTPTGTSVVALPVIDPSGGEFVGSVRLTLKCPTPGAKIRYTTNGKEPVKSSPVYRRPFVLKKSAVIKVKAFLNGVTPSHTVSATFTKSGTVR